MAHILVEHHARLLAQGIKIKNNGASVSQNIAALLKEIPALSNQLPVVNAFMFEIGYTSADLGKAYAKAMVVEKPKKLLKLFLSTGMLPNQVNSAMTAAGGAYVDMATKTLDNVAVQKVFDMATIALSPAEDALRKATQIGTTLLSGAEEAGEAVVEFFTDLGKIFSISW